MRVRERWRESARDQRQKGKKKQCSQRQSEVRLDRASSSRAVGTVQQDSSKPAQAQVGCTLKGGGGGVARSLSMNMGLPVRVSVWVRAQKDEVGCGAQSERKKKVRGKNAEPCLEAHERYVCVCKRAVEGEAS